MIKTKWEFFNPKFEYLKDCKDYTWFGHIFFTYDLVRNLQPRRVVELGTYRGTSICSFAQAVKDGDLNTEINAIDSWEGDENTGFYEQRFYDDVKELTTSYFPDQNIKLHKMYFEDALHMFKDKSIDILHIDGLHTYEAVKKDYQDWKNKVKDDGVILFHDTYVEEYGVKEVWKEVLDENKGAFSINFNHHFGLGVLFKDPTVKDAFRGMSEDEIIKYYRDAANSYTTSMDLVKMQGERDRIFYDLIGSQKETKYFVEKLNKSSEELSYLYDKKAIFYANYAEAFPLNGVNDFPSEIEVLRDWLFRDIVIKELEKHNRELLEENALLNRRFIKLFLKLDRSILMRNRIIRKVARVSLRSIVGIKNILKS